MAARRQQSQDPPRLAGSSLGSRGSLQTVETVEAVTVDRGPLWDSGGGTWALLAADVGHLDQERRGCMRLFFLRQTLFLCIYLVRC